VVGPLHSYDAPYGFPAPGSGVLRLPLRRRPGDGSSQKGGLIIVASIAHDIWLGCTLALATLVGLFTIVLAVSRRVREEL